MKTLLLTLAVLLSADQSMAIDPGGEAGNGGGDYVLESLPFPDSGRIQKSLALIKEKISRDQDQDLLRGFAWFALEDLIANKSIRYFKKEIITIGDATVTAHMGYTLNRVIYFSPPALRLSNSDFTELLLHEVFHVSLPKALAEDEFIVKELARAVITNDQESKVRASLRSGAYVRADHISLDQILEAFDQTYKNQLWWCLDTGDDTISYTLLCKMRAKESILLRVRNRLGSEVSRIATEAFLNLLAEEINRSLPVEYPSAEELRSVILPEVLATIAKAQGLPFHWPPQEEGWLQQAFGF